MTNTSVEYAQALFALAKEENKLDEITASLNVISDVFHKYPEYIDFLSSPNIIKSERIKAIEDAFSEKVEPYVLYFVMLLCEKGHIRAYDECVAEYKELCDMSNKISVAEVVSAVKLTEKEKSALKKKLEAVCGNSVNLVCSVDKELIGGIIVKFDGKVIDGSVKHKLRELKGAMYG
ncbi:MAG: ATP synthase F1 subunit delta, partial [Ruminococcus sp.]|nr:ATP synthase F1 subunit delta [Candidatus Copronaster equi]